MRPAIDRFAEHPRTAPTRTLDRGPARAVVFTAGGLISSWAWVVFRDGRVVAGRTHWDLDGYQACAEALAALEAAVPDAGGPPP